MNNEYKDAVRELKAERARDRGELWTRLMHEAQGASAGALAGSVAGLAAGPKGVLAGAICGFLFGGITGAGLDYAAGFRALRDRELDTEDALSPDERFGVPSLAHPPSRR